MEIKVVRQVLEWNQNCHEELKKIFDDNNVLVINVMGSPGGGKTTLIKKVIEKLCNKYNIGVIEADIAGKVDAERIAAMGIPVVQLNTDGACHTEAMSIKNIIPDFDLKKLDIIIIENIGNLVCPAEFDIGEDLKVALLSIPEGDDKPEKYPLMFTRANALVLTKYDMINYFEFDEKRVFNAVNGLNSGTEIFKVSSTKNEGVDDFVSWVEKYIKRK